MKFRELSIDEYKKFIKNYKNSNFFQDNRMDNYSKLKGYISYYVGVEENESVVAAARLLAKKSKFGKYNFSSPRGLLVDYNNFELLEFFVNNLKKYIKTKNGLVLKIDPYIIYKSRDIEGNETKEINNFNIVNNLKKLGFIHGGFTRGYDLSGQGRWYFVLDLENKSLDDIQKGMKANHRNIIRKAEKYGVEIKQIEYNDLPTFKHITEDTSARIGFSDKSLVYYQTMYDSFKDEVKYLIAYLNVDKYKEKLKEELEINQNKYKLLSDTTTGKAKELKITIDGLIKRLDESNRLKEKQIPISCAMFMLYNGEVDYLFSGSLSEYKNLYAQYLIQWHMIKYAIENNYKKYNFFGISGIFDKKDSEYGVYEFKKGFGGVVEELIGDFYLPTSILYKIKRLIKDRRIYENRNSK